VHGEGEECRLAKALSAPVMKQQKPGSILGVSMGDSTAGALAAAVTGEAAATPFTT
jgi:hypothetical protein